MPKLKAAQCGPVDNFIIQDALVPSLSLSPTCARARQTLKVYNQNQLLWKCLVNLFVLAFYSFENTAFEGWTGAKYYGEGKPLST